MLSYLCAGVVPEDVQPSGTGPARMGVQVKHYPLVGEHANESTKQDLIDASELDMQALLKLWQQFDRCAEYEEDDTSETPPVVHRVADIPDEEKARALCLVLQGGRRIFLAYDDEIQYYSRVQAEVIWALPEEVRPGDAFVSIKSDAARDLFSLVLDGVGRTPVMIALQGNLERWRQILDSLLVRFESESEPYQCVLNEIRLHGGDVKTLQSVRAWVSGRTVFVKHKQNVLAVCLAAGVSDPERTADTIYKAMQTLWAFRRKIGRKLGALIRQQISHVMDPGAIVDDIIEAPGGVRLSMADLAEALEVHEVVRTLPGEWCVPRGLLGWIITASESAELLAKGVIKGD